MSEREPDAEHQVTPLELFFDLTFVFAMTQVTAMLADDPTWSGVLRGMLVLAALWWGWSVYAWLTSATDVDEGGVRLVMLAAMGAMFGVALSVPGAFGALGLKTTVDHVGETLDTVPAVALCGGAALYLLGHVAFLFRMTRHLFRRRTIGGAVLLLLIPVALVVPALAALALVSAVCSLIVAYEALRYREHRLRVRHPEPAG